MSIYPLPKNTDIDNQLKLPLIGYHSFSLLDSVEELDKIRDYLDSFSFEDYLGQKDNARAINIIDKTKDKINLEFITKQVKQKFEDMKNIYNQLSDVVIHYA